MSDSDMQQFRIDLSRELGAITERLRSIDEHLAESKNTTTTMWRKIDKLNEELTSLKIKVAVVSMIISLIVSNADALLRFLD